MTTPKKPATRPARLQSVASDAVQPLLTLAELALLRSYRATNERQQQNMIRSMAAMAERFPRMPALRLVVGGAS